MPNDFSYKGNELAYPAQSRNGHEDFCAPQWGLTKREFICAQLMAGAIAHHGTDGDMRFYSDRMIQWTDALLAELAK